MSKEQAPQAPHTTSLTEFNKNLDSTLSKDTWCGSWGCPVQGQELNLVILVGPFQLRISYDSIMKMF